MPNTTTRSISTAPSNRSVAVDASLVPMPVAMATTSCAPSVPEWTLTPPIAALRSESLRTSGFNSMGMAQMNAMQAMRA